MPRYPQFQSSIKALLEEHRPCYAYLKLYRKSKRLVCLQGLNGDSVVLCDKGIKSRTVPLEQIQWISCAGGAK